jgi:hypothetical protein
MCVWQGVGQMWPICCVCLPISISVFDYFLDLSPNPLRPALLCLLQEASSATPPPMTSSSLITCNTQGTKSFISYQIVTSLTLIISEMT